MAIQTNVMISQEVDSNNHKLEITAQTDQLETPSSLGVSGYVLS